MGVVEGTQSELLERLQFLVDSGWDVRKGAPAAKEVIAGVNGLNGDIAIVPVFDGFHDVVWLDYYSRNRKNPSPLGDLWLYQSSKYTIDLGLIPPPRERPRRRGEYTGKYIICRGHNPHSDFMEAFQREGLHFTYDSNRRLFVPKD
jgi:hypothetical protein